VSLVAVVKRSGDVKDQIPSTRIVPVGMPADMQFTSMFKKAMAPAGMVAVPQMAMPMKVTVGEVQSFEVTRARISEIEAKALKKLRHPGSSRKFMDFLDRVFDDTRETAPAQPQTDDLLVSLAGMLEPDKGMPGKKHELRIVNSVAALLFFYEHGNSATSGTFRVHVVKLLRFLTPERLKQLSAKHESAARRVLELIKAGRPVSGSWEQFVEKIVKNKRLDVSDFWAKVEGALTPVESAAVSRE
jgi:hypothetical protein